LLLGPYNLELVLLMYIVQQKEDKRE